MRGDRSEHGLTLVEVVVAIVVIALGVTAILAMLAQGFRTSPDPQLRIKTVELAQAYMEEIFPKAYAPDGVEADRSLYDDLEDYDGLCEGTAAACDCSVDGPIRDARGNPRGGRYAGYCVAVDVVDESEAPAVNEPLAGVDDGDARRIDIVITDPRGFDTTFAAYRLDLS